MTRKDLSNKILSGKKVQYFSKLLCVKNKKRTVKISSNICISIQQRQTHTHCEPELLEVGRGRKQKNFSMFVRSVFTYACIYMGTHKIYTDFLTMTMYCLLPKLSKLNKRILPQN